MHTILDIVVRLHVMYIGMYERLLNFSIDSYVVYWDLDL